MERITERLIVARKALSTLQELTNKPSLSVVERDAAIQRFEYTFEATWKSAQQFLNEFDGIIANSPKSVVRACRLSGLFDDVNAQTALQMCEARNNTVHTYNEKLAMAIYNQIKTYVILFEVWITAMEQKLKGESLK